MNAEYVVASCLSIPAVIAINLLMIGCAHDKAILRGQVEATLPGIESRYRTAQGGASAQKAYAAALYKLGDMRRAHEVVGALITDTTDTVDDLLLGARLAYLLGNYGRAEALFERSRDLAPRGTKARTDALEGLVLTYYQTNRFDRSISLVLAGQRGLDADLVSLLAFMKAFVGRPYEIAWADSDHVAHLPIVNDFTPAGALPLVRLKVNGRPLEFIVDTGGDRLYIDSAAAKAIGIRNLATRRAKYAFTKGKDVSEQLGVASSVEMGEVTLRNVPVIATAWKASGQTSDGVVTTQMLKQFLSTIDYDKKEITFRERSPKGKKQFLDSLRRDPVVMPFWMANTHLLFTSGNINGRRVSFLIDSGLAASMPIAIADEAVDDLGLASKKARIPGTPYYWVPIDSFDIGGLQGGATQALGNVFVDDPYWSLGFCADALISHQYLRLLGSWTIDFDSMSVYFPAHADPTAIGAS